MKVEDWSDLIDGGEKEGVEERARLSFYGLQCSEEKGDVLVPAMTSPFRGE